MGKEVESKLIMKIPGSNSEVVHEGLAAVENFSKLALAKEKEEEMARYQIDPNRLE